jgi:hypothetical protein
MKEFSVFTVVGREEAAKHCRFVYCVTGRWVGQIILQDGRGEWEGEYEGEVGPDFQAGRRWARARAGPGSAFFCAFERDAPWGNRLRRGVPAGRGASSPPARPEVSPHPAFFCAFERDSLWGVVLNLDLRSKGIRVMGFPNGRRPP